MKAEEINQLLKNIYDKETTTEEEKKALLEACGCVWASRTVFCVKTFMKK